MRGSTPLTGREDPYLVNLGYDILKSYTATQIIRMYIAEGMPEEEAKEKGKELARELHRMDVAEWRSWSDRWDHEIAAGLNPEAALTWRETRRAKAKKDN
jgi:hypothetical protein